MDKYNWYCQGEWVRVSYSSLLENVNQSLNFTNIKGQTISKAKVIVKKNTKLVNLEINFQIILLRTDVCLLTTGLESLMIYD